MSYLSQSNVEGGRLVKVRCRLVSLFLLHLYLTQLLLLQSYIITDRSRQTEVNEQTNKKEKEGEMNTHRDRNQKQK